MKEFRARIIAIHGKSCTVQRVTGYDGSREGVERHVTDGVSVEAINLNEDASRPGQPCVGVGAVVDVIKYRDAGTGKPIYTFAMGNAPATL